MASKKWDDRFLEMAKLVASWSKDISTKVGAVIVDKDNRIISVGYNGFCRNADDSMARIVDREVKLANTIHGEENAILFADRDRLVGATLYTWPFQPCSRCANIICQVGISMVISTGDEPERWKESFEQARKTFIDCGVKYYISKN
jgi:dCMP deaminase